MAKWQRTARNSLPDLGFKLFGPLCSTSPEVESAGSEVRKGSGYKSVSTSYLDGLGLSQMVSSPGFRRLATISRWVTSRVTNHLANS